MYSKLQAANQSSILSLSPWCVLILPTRVVLLCSYSPPPGALFAILQSFNRARYTYIAQLSLHPHTLNFLCVFFNILFQQKREREERLRPLLRQGDLHLDLSSVDAIISENQFVPPFLLLSRALYSLPSTIILFFPTFQPPLSFFPFTFAKTCFSYWIICHRGVVYCTPGWKFTRHNLS